MSHDPAAGGWTKTLRGRSTWRNSTKRATSALRRTLSGNIALMLGETALGIDGRECAFTGSEFSPCSMADFQAKQTLSSRNFWRVIVCVFDTSDVRMEVFQMVF